MTLPRMLCGTLCAVTFGAPFAVSPAAAEARIPLNGVLRNHQGKVLPGVTVRAYRRVAPGWQVLTTSTRPDGTFSLKVPKDDWVVMADADELLARGYFCVPGWIVGGPGCVVLELPLGVPRSPLTCGLPGESIRFEAVPTRPDFSVTKAPGKDPVLHLSYPWTTLPMQLVRQYVIEKSVDMVHWEAVSTVTLDGFGRLDVPDTASANQPFCMYRAVEAAPLTISVSISP